MIRSLWTAKTGLEAQQVQMDVITNNLSNVSTTGFKRSRAIFEDLLYQNLRQPGANASAQGNLPSGMQVGAGVRPVATERLHTQGNLQQTSNSRDLAINGSGFFQVLMPDGTLAYTRDGSFQVDQNGQVVTSGGYPLEPALMIPTNAMSVTVSHDGIVSITEPGNTLSQQIGQISLSMFVNPAGLESKGQNLYVETTASGPRLETLPTLNGAGNLYQGYVETSNVNVVEEMVNMIQIQRAYEINSRAVQTSDEMLARLAQL
jgi:flagellar basal-body rod protein FlgG